MLSYYYGYFDPTYILIIIAAIFSLLAQAKVSTTFNRYSKIHSHRGMTGAQVAEKILRSKGIYDVRIEKVSGKLTDHYDPRNHVLRLSSSTYDNTSVAAIGVAAHECGHAIQHNQGYLPLNIRSVIAPVAQIGSYASWFLILIGLFFTTQTGNVIIQIGIWCFVAVVAFQVITLPVEINASRKALKILNEDGILVGEEQTGARKVLTAAAMTYIAAMATAILQLLRLILLFGGRRRD